MNLRLFIARVYHNLFTKEKRFAKWSYYDKTQWLPNDKLIELQKDKLKSIIDYSVTNVPAFQYLKDKVTGNPMEDIQLFPVTDKKFYREEGDATLSLEKDELKYFQSSTSGSTGESFYFYLDEQRIGWANAAKLRTDTFAGILPSNPRASLWGASFDNKGNKSIVSKFRSFLTPFTFLSSYNISEENFFKYVKILHEKKPKLLVSYSTPLMEFAKYCNKHKVKLPYFKAIISSSEQLFDFQKEFIQETFGVKVYNRYGTREFGSIAQECKCQNGLHVNIERLYIEILDENNQPCVDEEKGQLVITDLDNKVMPLIRYKVGDFSAWSKDQYCECGRGLQKLKFIEGRSFDVIRTPNGQVISGTFWTLLLRFVSKDIYEFQVLQNTIDQITIQIVHPEGKLSDRELDELLKKIAEKDNAVKVIVEYVNDIPLTKSGKRKFIISNL